MSDALVEQVHTLQRSMIESACPYLSTTDVESLRCLVDFSYTFTQNAAGVAQIAICITGGSCATGIPGLQYPFGDQVSDAAEIKKGFDYEAAKRAGCQ